MDSKEKWIEQTLSSADRLPRAEVSLDLYNKISRNWQQTKIISIRPQTIWRAAAAIVLLVALNVFTVLHLKKSEALQPTRGNAFAQEYFSNTNSVQF